MVTLWARRWLLSGEPVRSAHLAWACWWISSTKAFGPGQWLLDRDWPEPDPAPVTTIAWRLGQLHACFAGRWAWTFGARQRPVETLVDFTLPHPWPWSGSGR